MLADISQALVLFITQKRLKAAIDVANVKESESI